MELEIETRIKNYWASKERLMPETILNKVKEIWKSLQAATPENPVNSDEFLSALNLDCCKTFLKGYIAENLIIQFRSENESIVHRVYNVYNKGNTQIFITKGDANYNPEGTILSQQIMGNSFYFTKNRMETNNR